MDRCALCDISAPIYDGKYCSERHHRIDHLIDTPDLLRERLRQAEALGQPAGIAVEARAWAAWLARNKVEKNP